MDKEKVIKRWDLSFIWKGNIEEGFVYICKYSRGDFSSF